MAIAFLALHFVIGFTSGSAILLTLLLGSLWLWHRTMASVAVDTVNSPKTEMFYWITIMFSQTLRTALGNWTSDSMGLEYTGAALVFGTMLAVIAVAYFRKRTNRTALFWAAFVITWPLGAVVGDFLDKSIAKGGLDLSRYSASGVLILLIVFCILYIVLSPSSCTESSLKTYINET